MILPPSESIVERKTCPISGEEFFITDKDLEFYDKVSPVFGGKKYSIPSPTIAPNERMVQKFAWRNERNLYRRKCDLSGKDIVSMYHPDLPYTVYDPAVWWSDDWSCTASGRSPDWNKPFFDQFETLFQTAPLLAISTLFLENSEFTNGASYLKNCYLCFDVDYLENCYYVWSAIRCNNCFESQLLFDSDFCYECFNCKNCNTVLYSADCDTCANCMFCYGCKGCTNCLFCFNAYRKNFAINNIEYAPEEYTKRKQEILRNQSIATMQEYFLKKRKEYPVKYMHGTMNEGCTGDYVYESKNAYNAFECHHIEDCRNNFYIFNAKNCYDHIIYGDASSFVYHSIATGLNVNTCAFCAMCWDNMRNAYYCLNITSSKDCFGCVGMKKGQYCLLNTPYSVHEYEKLAGKMIDHMRATGEWGEFFPMRLSPYGYNETVGSDYTPLTHEEVLRRGWKWTNYEPITAETGYAPLPITHYDEKIVGYEQAQKNIDACLAGQIVCRESHRPFRIQKRELGFYIENSLPIPLFHPTVRHTKRIKEFRAWIILHERTCDTCKVPITTPYASTKPEKVLCETCYRKLVY